MSKRSKQNDGLTLMELTLYVGIASILLVISSLFLSTLLQSRIKNQTIAEVDQQGLQVMNIITQTLRNAQTINSPVYGVQDVSMSLDTYDSDANPTLFYISEGVIVTKEGSGNTISLTNPRVSASNLTFLNNSDSGTPGIIRISFTLNYHSEQDWNEYSFSKTFYASASVRQP